jgi:hypothetical protein
MGHLDPPTLASASPGRGLERTGAVLDLSTPKVTAVTAQVASTWFRSI